MKKLDIEQMTREVKQNGYSFVSGYLTDDDIQLIEMERDSVLEDYSESLVKKRLFYLREESGNKQGDAVMMSFKKNKDLPSLCVRETSIISELLEDYNSLVGELTGKQVPPESRAMFNSQMYYENSLDCHKHFDGEFFSFKHTKDDKHNEYEMILEKGLIPRYVIVFVLHNDNENGHGTYITTHDSDERIHINAFAGDMFIFDNLAVRHGVPSLPKSRSMIGFRNFDHMPYLFESEPEGGNGWIELEDTTNPGWYREISSEYARELMVEFNEKWKTQLFEEQIKKPAAF